MTMLKEVRRLRNVAQWIAPLQPHIGWEGCVQNIPSSADRNILFAPSLPLFYCITPHCLLWLKDRKSQLRPIHSLFSTQLL